MTDFNLEQDLGYDPKALVQLAIAQLKARIRRQSILDPFMRVWDFSRSHDGAADRFKVEARCDEPGISMTVRIDDERTVDGNTYGEEQCND